MHQVPTTDLKAEYDCLNTILQREELLKRIQSSNRLDYLLYDLYREITLQVVEHIQRYDEAQLSTDERVPLLWNGEPYLNKILNDLPNDDRVLSWLQFPIQNNPFLVPSDLLEGNFSLSSDAYVEFGYPPPLPSVTPKSPLKSRSTPYLTPITNDIEIVTSVYAIKRLSQHESEFRKQSMSQVRHELRRRTDHSHCVVLSSEEVGRIRRCWSYLTLHADLISDIGDKHVHLIKSSEKVRVWTRPLLEKNEELRLEEISSSSKKWTPHEIRLKTLYSRRIGDLIQLTAASTQGRVLAPFRQTRFRRLINDLRLVTEQVSSLRSTGEHDVDYIRCVEGHKSRLEYLLKAYTEVAARPLDDLEAERERMQLPEGYSLPADHFAAIALEDRMATKIQRRARVRFGRTFLRLMKRQQIQAALAIQKTWRRHSVRHETKR